jgi:hypothetical protein
MNDRPVREVAREVGLSAGAASVRLWRLIRRVREGLEGLL